MGEPILGIDLSHHQGDDVRKADGLAWSHWQALRRCGVRFAVIKATQGTGHVDEDVERNLKRARRAGMFVGVYHFLEEGRGQAQADHFLRVVSRANGGSLRDLMLVADVERVPGGGSGDDPKGPTIRAFGGRLRSKAKRNSRYVYSAAGYWRAIGNPDLADLFDGLWQARWDGQRHRCKKPNLPARPPRAGFGGWSGRPAMWQFGMLRYGVGGKLRGIDGNAFYGKPDRLDDIFSTGAPAKPEPEPEPRPIKDRAGYRSGTNALVDQALSVLAAMPDPPAPHPGAAWAAGVAEAREDILEALEALKLGGPS